MLSGPVERGEGLTYIWTADAIHPIWRTMLKILLSPLRLALETVLTLIVILDELARPIYRPLIAWVASWTFMYRFEAWIAGRSRWTVLVLIAIPLAIVEPMKFVALFVIAQGHIKSGTLALAFAYLASFVIVERIFSAGRPQLMSFAIIAWSIGVMVKVREALLAVLRESALWQLIGRVKMRVRLMAGRFLARLRARI